MSFIFQKTDLHLKLRLMFFVNMPKDAAWSMLSFDI